MNEAEIKAKHAMNSMEFPQETFLSWLHRAAWDAGGIY